jgi:hypothetical protein
MNVLKTGDLPMKPVLILLLAAFVFAACSIMPTPDGSSGIYGRVTIGPICPVVQPGKDCPDRPYQATLNILTTSGNKVARTVTDADGNFRVNLLPGNYILHPETPQNQPLPRAQEQTFTVVAGRFIELNVTYDSGIR